MVALLWCGDRQEHKYFIVKKVKEPQSDITSHVAHPGFGIGSMILCNDLHEVTADSTAEYRV